MDCDDNSQVVENLPSAVRNGQFQEVNSLLQRYSLSTFSSWLNGYNMLKVAISLKNIEIAKLLIAHGCSVNGMGNEFTPLHLAVQINNKELVSLLLKKGACVTTRDTMGRTPYNLAIRMQSYDVAVMFKEYEKNGSCAGHDLYRALEAGNLSLLEELISSGMDINFREPHSGYMLLHVAAEKGYINIVKCLINRGAQINSLCHYTYGPENSFSSKLLVSPFVLAVKNGHSEVTKMLLKSGARHNIKELDKSIMHYAVESEDLKTVEVLLNYRFPINSQFYYPSQRAFYTPLELAVSIDNIDIVRSLLNVDSSIVSSDTECKIIQIAIKQKSVNMFNFLLSQGFSVNGFYKGMTMLHCAAHAGAAEIAGILIEKGANIDFSCEHNGEMVENILGFTPLHFAVKSSDVDTVKILVEYGCDVNTIDNSENSTLYYAIENRSIRILETILRGKPNINSKAHHKAYLIALSSSRDFHEEITMKLFQYGFKLSSSSHVKSCIKNGYFDIYKHYLENSKDLVQPNFDLVHASKFKQIRIVQELIKFGANVNFIYKDYRSAMYYAIKNKDSDLRNLLLSNGTIFNSSLLPVATKTNDVEILKAIFEENSKIDVNSFKNGQGNTLVHIAAHYNSLEALKLIIKSGGVLDSKNNNGETALHYACEYQNMCVLKTLLKFGADVYLKNNLDQTPLHIACQNTRSDIVIELLKYMVDINSVDVHGNTALHIASRTENILLIQILLSFGSDINIENKLGMTPLAYLIRSLNFTSESIEGFKLFMRHIIKMESLGLIVSSDNLKSKMIACRTKRLKTACLYELKKMKLEKVTPIISFYDLLQKDARDIEIYLRDRTVIETLKKCMQLFPLFWNNLYYKVLNGLRRKILVKKSMECLCSLFPSLTFDCSEIIINYLSCSELKILCGCNKAPDSWFFEKLIEKVEYKDNFPNIDYSGWDDMYYSDNSYFSDNQDSSDDNEDSSDDNEDDFESDEDDWEGLIAQR